MSSTPLPKQLDIRKLIAADAEISAREPLQKFARLATMLAKSEGGDAAEVELKLHLYVDEAGNKRIDGDVHAEVRVLCQRCLQPMPLQIDSDFAVGVVWSDDESSRLPKYLEPYVVDEGPQDIRDLIEDELILCVPYASYHDDENCAGEYRHEPAEEIVETEKEKKPNPFKVLEQLKPSKH
ncbi:MAG: YceD family protein [Spongiibacteraceae bacterium]